MTTNVPNVPTYTGDVPLIGQGETEFSQNAQDSLVYQADLPVNLNTSIAAMNTLGGEVEDLAASAELSNSQAAAVANFKGNWSGLTGALSTPASVKHNGLIWLLLNDLADVTASEPGVSVDWEMLGNTASLKFDTIADLEAANLPVGAFAHVKWVNEAGKVGGGLFEIITFAESVSRGITTGYTIVDNIFSGEGFLINNGNVAVVNDNLFGFQNALLKEAGIVPDGIPDVASRSKLVSAINKKNVINALTLQDAIEIQDVLAGSVVLIAERIAGNGGGGLWEYVDASSVVVNDANIVQCTCNASLALTLVIQPVMSVKQFGAVGDGVNNDRDAIFIAVNTMAGGALIFDNADEYLLAGDGAFMEFLVSDFPNGITIDFNNQKINSTITRLTDGSQGGQFDNNYGVFTFRGEDVQQNGRTSGALTAPVTSLPEPIGITMSVGDLYMIESVDPADGGSGEFKYRTINRVARLEAQQGGQLYFDNRFEFDIANNSVISYTKINPIRGIHLKNVRYDDNSAFDAVDRDNGLCFVVFERAYRCSVNNVEVDKCAEFGVYVIKSNHMSVKGVSYLDPKDTVSGGYLVQFLKSSHVYAAGCDARQERHLVDFTASAYGVVERCGSLFTANGTFTTHGAYEHDISYRNNYGYMSFTNSGETFGSATRNVVIDKHVGTIFNAGQNVSQGLSDYKITNSHFSSVAYLNLDGANIDNCEFDGLVYFAQVSSRSKAKNIFTRVTMPQVDIDAFNGSSVNVTNPIIDAKTSWHDCTLGFNLEPTINAGKHDFVDCELTWSGSPIIDTRLRFQGGDISSSTTSGASAMTVSADFELKGTTVNNQGFLFAGTSDQKVLFDGLTGVYDAAGMTSATFESTKSAGKLKLKIVNSEVNRNESGAGATRRLLTFQTSGSTLQLNISNNNFSDCDKRVDASLFGAGKNALVYTSNIEDAVTDDTGTFPSTGTGVVVDNNVTV